MQTMSIEDAILTAKAEVLHQIQTLITELAEEQPALSPQELVLYTLSRRIADEI